MCFRTTRVQEVCSFGSSVLVFVLQVSQYTFAMCSYREKKAEPQELMQLEGYTVDYCDPQPGRRTWRGLTLS